MRDLARTADRRGDGGRRRRASSRRCAGFSYPADFRRDRVSNGLRFVVALAARVAVVSRYIGGFCRRSRCWWRWGWGRRRGVAADGRREDHGAQGSASRWRRFWRDRSAAKSRRGSEAVVGIGRMRWKTWRERSSWSTPAAPGLREPLSFVGGGQRLNYGAHGTRESVERHLHAALRKE